MWGGGGLCNPPHAIDAAALPHPHPLAGAGRGVWVMPVEYLHGRLLRVRVQGSALLHGAAGLAMELESSDW